MGPYQLELAPRLAPPQGEDSSLQQAQGLPLGTAVVTWRVAQTEGV